MKKLFAVLLLSSLSFAGVAKVVSQPVRHPKKDAKAVRHALHVAGSKVGHGVKKVVF